MDFLAELGFMCFFLMLPLLYEGIVLHVLPIPFQYNVCTPLYNM